MIIRFKYGFKEGDFLYGWKEKHPYRLPQQINKRFYGLKKVGKYKELFYINRKLKSIAQLKSMTIEINVDVEIIEDEDVPF